MEYEKYTDDLDTMVDPSGYLDDDEVSAMEEGFIRGYAEAA